MKGEKNLFLKYIASAHPAAACGRCPARCCALSFFPFLPFSSFIKPRYARCFYFLPAIFLSQFSPKYWLKYSGIEPDSDPRTMVANYLINWPGGNTAVQIGPLDWLLTTC